MVHGMPGANDLDQFAAFPSRPARQVNTAYCQSVNRLPTTAVLCLRGALLQLVLDRGLYGVSGPSAA
jgi:hypothetical protein